GCDWGQKVQCPCNQEKIWKHKNINKQLYEYKAYPHFNRPVQNSYNHPIYFHNNPMDSYNGHHPNPRIIEPNYYPQNTKHHRKGYHNYIDIKQFDTIQPSPYLYLQNNYHFPKNHDDNYQLCKDECTSCTANPDRKTHKTPKKMQTKQMQTKQMQTKQMQTNTNANKTNANKTNANKTNANKTNANNKCTQCKQNKCKQNKCKQNKCKQNKCKQNKCKQNKCKQNKCKQNKCKQNKCKQLKCKLLLTHHLLIRDENELIYQKYFKYIP
ncbi:unnamed protein product, partial [Gordionus sp. m RMFG-2023]